MRTKGGYLQFVFLVVIGASRVGAQALVPIGVEFQVNMVTVGRQTVSQVASDAEGDFVVVWSVKDGQGADTFDVFARRFASSGAPLGSEFLVNSSTLGYQSYPAIDVSPNGDFVVVWRSHPAYGTEGDIHARRFASSGAALGVEFQVNVFSSVDHDRPAVAIGAGGSFAVVWQSYQLDSAEDGIALRRFDAAGAALGSELVVNAYTLGQQGFPSIAADAAGGFVVVWESSQQDGSAGGLIARRFSSSGVGLAAEFLVNAHTLGDQVRPSLGVSAAGDFVVVWNGVVGRRVDSLGTPLGSDFLLSNDYPVPAQAYGRVGFESGGAFIVAWMREENGAGDVNSAVMRRFGADGQARAPVQVVSAFTPNSQAVPSIAMQPAGNFVVTWTSEEQDGDGSGIFARRFHIPASIDVDGDGQYQPLTDGLLLLRFGFGFTGNTLIIGAVNMSGCTRCDAPSITAYLQSLI